MSPLNFKTIILSGWGATCLRVSSRRTDGRERRLDMASVYTRGGKGKKKDHVCMHACAHAHIDVCACAVCVYALVYMCMCICIYMYIYVSVYMYAYTCTYTRVWMYICTRVVAFCLFVLSNPSTTCVCITGVFLTPACMCRGGWEERGWNRVKMDSACCWRGRLCFGRGRDRGVVLHVSLFLRVSGWWVGVCLYMRVHTHKLFWYLM